MEPGGRCRQRGDRRRVTGREARVGAIQRQEVEVNRPDLLIKLGPRTPQHPLEEEDDDAARCHDDKDIGAKGPQAGQRHARPPGQPVPVERERRQAIDARRPQDPVTLAEIGDRDEGVLVLLRQSVLLQIKIQVTEHQNVRQVVHLNNLNI